MSRRGCFSILSLIGMVMVAAFGVASYQYLREHTGVLIGLGVSVLLLIGTLFGSIYSAWMIRLGAKLVNDAAEHRATSDRAVASLGTALIKVIGRDEPASVRGDQPLLMPYQFPMIEAKAEPVEDEDFMA